MCFQCLWLLDRHPMWRRVACLPGPCQFQSCAQPVSFHLFILEREGVENGETWGQGSHACWSRGDFWGRGHHCTTHVMPTPGRETGQRRQGQQEMLGPPQDGRSRKRRDPCPVFKLILFCRCTLTASWLGRVPTWGIVRTDSRGRSAACVVAEARW